MGELTNKIDATEENLELDEIIKKLKQFEKYLISTEDSKLCVRDKLGLFHIRAKLYNLFSKYLVNEPINYGENNIREED